MFAQGEGRWGEEEGKAVVCVCQCVQVCLQEDCYQMLYDGRMQMGRGVPSRWFAACAVFVTAIYKSELCNYERHLCCNRVAAEF